MADRSLIFMKNRKGPVIVQQIILTVEATEQWSMEKRRNRITTISGRCMIHYQPIVQEIKFEEKTYLKHSYAENFFKRPGPKNKKSMCRLRFPEVCF